MTVHPCNQNHHRRRCQGESRGRRSLGRARELCIKCHDHRSCATNTADTASFRFCQCHFSFSMIVYQPSDQMSRIGLQLQMKCHSCKPVVKFTALATNEAETLIQARSERTVTLPELSQDDAYHGSYLPSLQWQFLRL